MQILRTILWVFLAIFIVIFVMVNFGEPQRVKIWISDDPIGFDWPVGIIALVFWLLGVIPTWLYHRGVKWSLGRRIRSLEASIKSNALAQRHAPEAASEDVSPVPAPEPADKPADKPVEKPVDKPAETADSLTPNNESTTP